MDRKKIDKRKAISLEELGEFGLIEHLARNLPDLSARVVKGIGDDTAVLKPEGQKLVLMTTDMLIEDVHFSLAWSSFRSAGWKALAVNVSDIAAMGGLPSAATVALGIPASMTVDRVENIYLGLGQCAGEYNVDIVGGDTVKSPGGLVINITLLGYVEKERVVYRSGARPGDLIMVTGPLGGSAAGLYALNNDVSGIPLELTAEAINSHLFPRARLQEGRLLSETGYVTSMNDISDGLASEVLELCKASGTGCCLEAGKVPFQEAVSVISEQAGVNLAEWTIYGGEDFELVFTVAPENAAKAAARLHQAGCCPEVVGTVTPPENGCILVQNGRQAILKPGGYNHFRE